MSKSIAARWHLTFCFICSIFCADIAHGFNSRMSTSIFSVLSLPSLTANNKNAHMYSLARRELFLTLVLFRYSFDKQFLTCRALRRQNIVSSLKTLLLRMLLVMLMIALASLLCYLISVLTYFSFSILSLVRHAKTLCPSSTSSNRKKGVVLMNSPVMWGCF